MRDYRRAAHTVYNLHYHFVFTTKYRKPVLGGEVAQEVRDLVREICRGQDIEILRGHVRVDHVHLLLSISSHLAPSRVMQAIKGKTSHPLLMDHGSCGGHSGAGPCGREATLCARPGT